MIYLTLADGYTGVYHSQVLDVCINFRRTLGIPIRLVALVPPSHFFKTYDKIKGILPTSLVLPMWPGRLDWRRNGLILKLLKKQLSNQVVICRGVLATNLMINLKKKGIVRKVIYDARGATAAEWKEYLYNENKKISREIEVLERNAVLKSDFRMSISDALVNYWNEQFDYKNSDHVIIPTTLSEEFLEPLIPQTKREKLRIDLGFSENDIVLVYSGSSAGWQSFSMLKHLVDHYFSVNPQIKLLILSKDPGELKELLNIYQNRVIITQRPHSAVFEALNAADYGLLIREKSVTNKVAAPTKYAEYLVSGLPVLLSGEVGDYTSFTTRHNCGFVLDSSNYPNLIPLTDESRVKNNKLAHLYFCKYSDYIRKRYQKVIKYALSK